ncbi:hypothetical protein RHOFW104T7_08760 [Rhodanobacter thiooxydans]|uniref:Uncharacterized protein n=2 Tax=Rhodanobacter thiooxydans TaxID=416169 RepID=A0A154QJE8_9GAMM|nr:hypothetical protein UUA_02086 [Rhodanobacter thiooxydans LCS2]KZC24372.1 hypothetical protein RHOFW104T7_08760 [Rhodanobacter thiooxydans]MCW0201325.1 hypothetical protein [Rhodanobacter thiooxydans]
MSSCSIATLLAAALVLPLAGCTPPEGVAVVDCEKPVQLSDNPWKRCTLRVGTFHGRAAATFRGKSPGFYRYFEAESAFRVERGRVRVTVRGSGEPVVFTVEPQRPWQGHIVARLNRQDRKGRSFTVVLEPEGDASGFQATVRHRDVQRSMETSTTVIPAIVGSSPSQG